ncbi:MAG TPA: urate hydroxylase PuuD [Thermoanaerobaculia bacterium]|nr:urate hydroxylase PuuD [Thermoanaerobaculia bacterium]
MNYTTQEALNLVLRWLHVFAAILWIGQTWFFTWLDGRLHDPDEKGQTWMVHSGGFYVVEKQTRPELTRTLHWFRWEAAITWLSGAALFVLLYYFGGILIDADSPLTKGQGIAASVGLLIGGWIVYDAFWISPLGRHETAGALISFLLLLGLAWLSTKLFSTRAAYLQVGAVMGTLMAANVWMRILPAQRKLIAAAREGKEPDQRLADRAKGRSKHNTFMGIPVVLIMISNHFPVLTYGHRYNWLILGGLFLVGAAAAQFLRKRG